VAGRAGRDALIALADVHRGHACEHPGRHDAARLPLSPEVAAASGGPRLARMIRSALRDYHLADLDETHAVRLFGSVVHGFIALERSGGFAHSEPTSQQSWEAILEALDATLRTWPSGTPLPQPTNEPKVVR
jgi:hypothetical protein